MDSLKVAKMLLYSKNTNFDDDKISKRYELNEDCKLEILTFESDLDGKKAYWHTTSHIMAQAVKRLFPDVKFAIGPSIENGFYYDIDPNGNAITAADFAKIEAKMIELAQRKEEIKRADISKEDALKLFGDRGEIYKCELINELEDGQITTYTQGAFTDLCRGPHIPNTAPIKAVKITSLAGAYWRGDEKRNQLVRVYGISFPKKKMLDEYLVLLEEAKKRDHRKLGKEMELFAFSANVGAGLPLWLPKGAALRDRLEQFLRKIQKQYGYQQVITPHIGNKLLYVTSGHYAKYGKDSFQPIHTPEEGEEYSADIITLSDENGDEYQFEIIDSIEYNEERYMAVVEMFDDSQKALEAEPVLIIFRVGEPDEDGLDTFDVVDDDEEYFEVAGIFEQRLSEIYNIEE